MVADNKLESPISILLDALERNCYDDKADKARRLLEAAPDMLSVCKKMLSRLTDDEVRGSWDMECQEMLKAVLAKAEGR